MTSPMPPGQTSLLLQMTQRLALSDAHFRRICQLIYQRAGIVLADHKRDMVYNRLVRRLRTLGLDDFGRYLSMLEANQNSAEWQAFINSLTTNLTAFFPRSSSLPGTGRARPPSHRGISRLECGGLDRGRALLAGDHPCRYPGNGAGSLESVRQRYRHRSAGEGA